jgi:tRNA(Ile)-lysidine synthase
VSAAEQAVSDREASGLFRGLEDLPGLLLAVSGGPDSTALLVLAARWAKQLKRAPKLIALTVDHGLRPEAAREAAAIKKIASRLGVPHRTLRWRGKKPRSGLQEAARNARYELLGQAARRDGIAHIATAHTLDDQAETMLFRMARGSGLLGLTGMAHVAPLPVRTEQEIFLIRPLLHLSKARLLATLKAAKIGYSEDPSNQDPRFTRVRWRALMPALAQEGLDARGLARLALRLRRAEATIAVAVDAARAALAPPPWRQNGPVVFETSRFARLPAEVGLRLLGEAVTHAGNEGPVELAKLEDLYEALRRAPSRLRRTLAGALITLSGDSLTVERAPLRRALAMRKSRKVSFTK